MGYHDERRQKRVRKAIRKTKKEMVEATEKVVEQIDMEERRRAAQVIINRVMDSLLRK
jgi:hypothetical protein